MRLRIGRNPFKVHGGYLRVVQRGYVYSRAARANHRNRSFKLHNSISSCYQFRLHNFFQYEDFSGLSYPCIVIACPQSIAFPVILTIATDFGALNEYMYLSCLTSCPSQNYAHYGNYATTDLLPRKSWCPASEPRHEIHTPSK